MQLEHRSHVAEIYFKYIGSCAHAFVLMNDVLHVVMRFCHADRNTVAVCVRRMACNNAV